VIDILTHYVDINILSACSDGVLKAPLHCAAEKGHIETVKFMLERFGAEVDRLDSRDQTALHYVLNKPYDRTRMRRREDYELTLEILMKSSSAINHQSKDGDTVLHMAAKHGYHKAVDMLLAGKADARLVNKQQQTARDTIPDHDLQMKQVFASFGVFSSPTLYPGCPNTPANSKRSKGAENKTKSSPLPSSGVMVGPAATVSNPGYMTLTSIRSENSDASSLASYHRD